jgi:hypothetical protein
MRRVAPSVIAREQLARLVDGGVDHEQNIVSALVETVTRLVVQELLEASRVTSSAAGVVTSAATASRSVRATATNAAGYAPPKDLSTSPCRRCVAPASRSIPR